MPTSPKLKNQIHGGLVRLVIFALAVLGLTEAPASAQTTTAATTINIAATSSTTTAKRLGMNLGTESYYDSGNLLRNIGFRNPGFEGEQWQSIIHCASVTATSCTDDNLYTAWPAGFLNGASAEFIVGKAAGTTATVTTSTAASVSGGYGVTINLSGLSIAPNVGDFVVVRFSVPGNAQAGWWPTGDPGVTFTTEFQDLSPNTPGKQALRVTTPAGANAVLASYMDDEFNPGDESFVQMNGAYTLTFRAKSTGGSNQMTVQLARPTKTYFQQTVTLTSSWQDYSFTMSNYDNGTTGALALKFYLTGASALLDDIALTAAPAANNPTAFRNEVVNTLRAYNPGSLRYMDSGYNWGSSIDNMLAVDFARERAGYSNWGTEQDQIPIGLNDFLVLCQAIGAEPWYTMQTGMTTQEMTNLMEYLGGPSTSTYGAKRAALGQVAPWTSVFPKIHLEFGNEVWNTANPGALMNDPSSYGQRAGVIFGAAKASPYYKQSSFDLILSGFEVNAGWNQAVLAASANYDTIDAATYFYTTLSDESSIENIFGPMFAEPEMVMDSPSGVMNAQAQVAAAASPPAKLAVYESQVSILQGTASQAGVNSAEPSLGGGIAQAENMLLAMRDLGVTDQEMFALGGYQYNFDKYSSTAAATTPIWGSVIDMGGLTNLQRPTFLAAELANTAILPTLLNTSQTGANPTWNSPQTVNDNFSYNGAHYIQSFAFTDGNKLNVILFNVSRTTALPVNFAGLNAPSGAATISSLVGPAITANNESGEQVKIQTTTQNLEAGATLTLPPYSMTVLSVAAPVIPIAINSISVTCPRTSLSPNDTMACSENVAGQGKYNSGVTWSVDNGTIGSDGTYVAPASVPASGKATIKVTSVQDTTKTASFSISIAPNVITGVAVTCGATTLGQGTTTSCSATVSGTGSFTNGYTWSISGGTISTTGNVTAPLTGTSVTITATSTQDKTKSGSATIALTPVLSISNPIYTTTQTSITVSWTNSLPARNGVQYGTGAPYLGASTPYDNTFTTSPSYTLTGLLPNTTYNLALIAYNDTQNAGKAITVTTGGTQAATITGVAVTCGSTSILLGATANCSATVSGTGSYSSAYTWSVSGGTISVAGLLTAPLTGTSVTVTATSTQDKTKSGSYTISLTPKATITSVGVTCASASIEQSSVTTCSAVVTGTGSFSSGTTWSVSAGTVSSSGVVNAPATGNTLTVTATSTQDTTKSGSFTVALTTPPATITGVAVSCGAASVQQGGTTTCSAVVSGTHSFSNLYTWSTTGGSISAGGVVTAPTTGSSVTVTATSTEDPTKTGSFTIALTVPPPTITGVAVTCGSASIQQGATTNCSAVVSGTNAFTKTYTWSVSAGSISSAGLVTAPTTGTSLTVTATSTEDPTKSGSFTIAVAPQSSITGVSVFCPATSLLQNSTTNCLSNVTGSGNFASGVTWSTSAGSISSTGVLSATTAGTVTVTATSTQDTTKSGTFAITVSSAMAISNAKATVTSTSITVSWTVNVASRNGVQYGIGQPWDGASTPYDSNFTLTPSYTLTGLQPGTTYNLLLISYNDLQNTAKEITVTTAPASTTSTISKVTVSCAASSVSLGGTTTCSGAVAGTGSYSSALKWSTTAGSIGSDGVLTAPSTGTSLVVTATSTQDPTKSGSYTVALKAEDALAISNPVTTFLSSTSVKVSWTVNQPARNGAQWGTGKPWDGESTPYDNNFTTHPSYILSGLNPGTVYNILLISYTDSGSTGKLITVTTPQ